MRYMQLHQQLAGLRQALLCQPVWRAQGRTGPIYGELLANKRVKACVTSAPRPMPVWRARARTRISNAAGTRTCREAVASACAREESSCTARTYRQACALESAYRAASRRAASAALCYWRSALAVATRSARSISEARFIAHTIQHVYGTIHITHREGRAITRSGRSRLI